MLRFLAVVAVVAAGVAFAACADGTLPPRSTADPANPNAPESPFTPPDHAAASSTSNESATSEGAQPGMVYACPMGHGVWPKPGTCPTCGMTLVPRPAPSASTSGKNGGMNDMPGMKTP